jgi:phosphoserine phosphatase
MGEILAREGPFDGLRANDVAFGQDGRLLDEAVIEVPIRAKGDVVRALRRQYGVSRDQTASIGDTQFDRGMFEESRVAVAFNPADEAVVRAATHVVREKDLRKAVAPLLDGMTKMG